MVGSSAAHVDERVLFGGLIVGGLAGLCAGFGSAGVALGMAAGGLGTAVSIVDVRERRIPDRLVVAIAAVAAVAWVLVHVVDGRAVGGVASGAAIGGVPLLVVHLVQPSGIGFGDVKYGAAMGALVGVLDWRMAAVMLTVGSLAALAGSVPVKTWRRSCPYGLMLTSGALTALGTARYL